jgi:hypothetical protein
VLPNNAKLHHNYARSLQGNVEEQEFHYRAAIRIYPYYGGWGERGDSCNGPGPKRPLRCWVGSAYINLGVVMANNGDLEGAIDIWKKGLNAWNQYVGPGQE